VSRLDRPCILGPGLLGVLLSLGCVGSPPPPPAGGEDSTHGTGSSGSLATADIGDPDTTTGPQGASEETTDPPTCSESHFVRTVVPARVVLVLDKSGSMVNIRWDHDDDPTTDEVTHWSSLHAAMDLVTTSFNGSIDFGLLLYPSLEATSAYDETACPVAESPEVPVAPGNAMAVMDVLPPADAPLMSIRGGTPSATALAIAVQHLDDPATRVPRSILFVTDGAANCRADATTAAELFEGYDESVHTVVADAWQAHGIATDVVGIAIPDEVSPAVADGLPNGINLHERLDLLAEQGGRPRDDGGPRYHATHDQLQLEAALTEILSQQLDCTMTLDPPPERPNLVQLEIDGQLLARIDDCATEDGWMYTSLDGSYDSIELCGAACALLAAQGALEATYGCPPPD
jgi:hypothetical protein